MKRTTLPLLAGCLALPLATSAETVEEKVERLEQQIEAMADLLESGAATTPGTSLKTHGMHATRGVTRIGGYGHLDYKNLDGGADKALDYHRFVLYVGHDFSEDIRFESELDLEHAIAGDGKKGTLELEQAYLVFDLNEANTLYTGLFLLPVGIINETHEPTTFYGVERNAIETNIIPTTWWEGGAMFKRRFGGGWSADIAVHTGLQVDPAKDYAVRTGRQYVAKAPADNLATTLRIRWSGLPGVTVAGSVQRQSDITQGTDPSAGAATLWTAHTVLSRGPFSARALVARWNLDGNGPRAVGADVQQGWYVEPAWKPHPQVGLFARYSEWNNRAGDNGGSATKSGNLGVNYWPHEEVVFKVEYQNQSSTAKDGFFLGMGYNF